VRAGIRSILVWLSAGERFETPDRADDGLVPDAASDKRVQHRLANRAQAQKDR
jgi:hypothetical protein